jgi:hypothetical protein
MYPKGFCTRCDPRKAPAVLAGPVQRDFAEPDVQERCSTIDQFLWRVVELQASPRRALERVEELCLPVSVTRLKEGRRRFERDDETRPVASGA